MKNIKDIKNYKITMALAFLVLLTFLSIFLYSNRYDWSPVDFPIEKLESNIQTEFRADLDVSYFVSIVVRPIKDFEYWNCVLRRTKEAESCNKENEFIFLEWVVEEESKNTIKVIRQGKQVLEGFNSSFFLTSFNTRTEATYKVSLILKGPEFTISHTKPRLKIEVDPLKSKDTTIVNLFLYFATIILVLITITAFFVEHKIYNRHSNE